jgi:hypothetical protein
MSSSQLLICGSGGRDDFAGRAARGVALAGALLLPDLLVDFAPLLADDLLLDELLGLAAGR